MSGSAKSAHSNCVHCIRKEENKSNLGTKKMEKRGRNSGKYTQH